MKHIGVDVEFKQADGYLQLSDQGGDLVLEDAPCAANRFGAHQRFLYHLSHFSHRNFWLRYIHTTAISISQNRNKVIGHADL